MGKKKSKFTKEFKLEAIKLATEQGYKQAQAAQTLGIDAKNLNRWLNEGIQLAKPAKGKCLLTNNEQEELQQLRKEVKCLKMEREILKKATAFFVNEKS
ncbi:MAG: transposase [Candidatus Aquirickettsiella sp.]